MNRIGWLIVIGLLLAPAVGTTPAAAQRGAGPGSRAELEGRLQEAFADRVSRRLGLDVEQARVLGEATLAFQAERQELLRRERALRTRYRGEPQGRRGTPGGIEQGELPLTAEQADGVLADMQALWEAEVDLRGRELARLREILGPEQVIRYYVLREQLAERVNAMRGRPPEAGGPEGRSGGGFFDFLRRRGPGRGGGG